MCMNGWERGTGGQVEDMWVCKHTFLKRRGITTKSCCSGKERGSLIPVNVVEGREWDVHIDVVRGENRRTNICCWGQNGGSKSISFGGRKRDKQINLFGGEWGE